MTVREWLRPVGTRGDGLSALLAGSAERFTSVDDAELTPLLDRIGASRVVLIGEASHGTSEFYRMRARITRELIERGGIRFVALEADWPDAAGIDRYVRHVAPGDDGGDEAEAFARFPTWMWRNEEVLEWVEWLRAWNEGRPPAERVAVHGMDLYSLGESVQRVVAYLEDIDPEAAEIARRRYECLSPFVSDPAIYGYVTMSEGYRSCEDKVVAMLGDLLDRRMQYVGGGQERYLDAAQNARLAANAERYYRAMYRSGPESWNLRDTHMWETVAGLLDAYGRGSRAVLWAHNSHLGNAAATEMADRGELNVGQLARQAMGDEAYLIGFGTHTGTVAAAHRWDGEVQSMDVRPSRSDSYERLFHDADLPGALLPLRESVAPDVHHGLMPPRLERAIGVVYRPETERLSHYFEARLPEQFDEYIWVDTTSAVRPLGRGGRVMAAGHPFSERDA